MPAERSHKSVGRAPGSQNFRKEDLAEILHFVEEFLPAGGMEWNKVADKYNEEYADIMDRTHRSSKALKTKFFELAESRKPTGDPECPPEVRLAKEIKRAIDEKVGLMEVMDNERSDVQERASPVRGRAEESRIADDDDDEGVGGELSGRLSPASQTRRASATSLNTAQVATRASSRVVRSGRSQNRNVADALIESLNPQRMEDNQTIRTLRDQLTAVQAEKLHYLNRSEALQEKLDEVRSQLTRKENELSILQMEIRLSQGPRGT